MALPVLAATAQESGTFKLNVDVASHIVFTNAGNVVALHDGVNDISYKTWDALKIAPAQGYAISSLTAYDAEGNETASHGWWFSSTDDSYSTQFSSYDCDGYTYRIKTRDYNPVLSNVSVTINDPLAVYGGTYSVGNVAVTAVEGTAQISFNPAKGTEFSLTLANSVSEAALTLNGIAKVFETNGLGQRSYTFDVADGDVIVLNATMEDPVFTLTLDNPEAVSVMFPDEDTPLSGLAIGANNLRFNVGDVITVKANEGFKVSDAEGLRYSSYTNTYTYTFKGGESGKDFAVTTEVYNPPTAVFNIYIEDPALVQRIVADVVVTKFEEGLNVLKMNLESDDSMQIVYKVNSTSEVEAKLGGQPLAVEETWLIASNINDIQPGTYTLTIGRPGYAPATGIFDAATAVDTFDVYTLQGISVMRGADADSLSALPAGLYIINGKKTLINK